jgi:hypothetical protein
VIRERRRKYLHLWTQDHDALPADAVAVYKATLALVLALFPQEFRQGKVMLPGDILSYLEEHGGFMPVDDALGSSEP